MRDFSIEVWINYYLIIRNDASDLFFFGYLAGRPMTGDGSNSIAIAYHILSRFLPFTGAIADIHKLLKKNCYPFSLSLKNLMVRSQDKFAAASSYREVVLL
jgi:hypothetical protein